MSDTFCRQCGVTDDQQAKCGTREEAWQDLRETDV